METLTDKIVKTRKTHTCWGCNREFPKGSSLRYITNVDGGSFSYGYWCKVCDAVIDTWEGYWDEISEGMVKDGDPEFWEVEREKIEGEK